MKPRAHDQLFAAAGVTAALSLIATGVTVLKGSVLDFNTWPLVVGDQPRRLELPTAPLSPATPLPDRGRARQQSSPRPLPPSALGVLGAGTVSRGGRVISSTGVLSMGIVVTLRQDGRLLARAGSVRLDGDAGSLGASSSSVDGGHAPVVVVTPAATPAAPDPGTTDTDGDGTPDTWTRAHSTPDSATDVPSNTDEKLLDLSTTFRPDPPAVTAPVDAGTVVSRPGPEASGPTVPATPAMPAPSDAAPPADPVPPLVSPPLTGPTPPPTSSPVPPETASPPPTSSPVPPETPSSPPTPTPPVATHPAPAALDQPSMPSEPPAASDPVEPPAASDPSQSPTAPDPATSEPGPSTGS